MDHITLLCCDHCTWGSELLQRWSSLTKGQMCVVDICGFCLLSSCFLVSDLHPVGLPLSLISGHLAWISDLLAGKWSHVLVSQNSSSQSAVMALGMRLWLKVSSHLEDICWMAEKGESLSLVDFKLRWCKPHGAFQRERERESKLLLEHFIIFLYLELAYFWSQSQIFELSFYYQQPKVSKEYGYPIPSIILEYSCILCLLINWLNIRINFTWQRSC
jgi:hypothetical protein